MPVIYRVGDLLSSGEEIIAHGVNTEGVMGAGIALAIRNRWPSVFDDYRRAHAEGKLRLGLSMMSMTEGENSPLGVINMVTQKLGEEPMLGNGMPVSYDAINCCFRTIERNPTMLRVAIPKIGAGLGGGDWNVIHHIIAAACPTTTVVVYVLGAVDIPAYGAYFA